MAKLPDFEGLAVFAKVVESRSFAGAARDLGLSKATVSKAVSRLEARLGARLFNRTSRRLALTDAGRLLSARAANILHEAEAAENETLSQSVSPRGLVRLAAPMSFGLLAIAPLMPQFLKAYPDVRVDLHLSDAMVDVIGDGFDAVLRIATLPDSSLIARRLCSVERHLVAAPSYLKEHGRPKHPMALAEHACLGYAYLLTPDTWHFTHKTGESATVHPAGGPLRVNNGDAMMPALLAGIGLGVLPDFILREALASGALERVLPDWSLAASALHWVTPPGGPRPARVDVLGEFLARTLSRPASDGTRQRSRDQRK
ncbi:MAG TPA: LysR family transcriptional regulator [Rhizomicrobium sp.]|jgi:DNA-binding transcriptional LysR family regulator|nr:LysR family transcriptional regulator [Rhizomicrobium sp.]